MEFSDLGKHCHFCNQKDYLPFRCPGCDNWFCLNHRNYYSHTCPKSPYYNKRTQPRNKTTTKSIRCPVLGCKRRDTIPCKYCLKKICVAHRFPDDHNCTVGMNNKKGCNKKISRILVNNSTDTQPKSNTSKKCCCIC